MRLAKKSWMALRNTNLQKNSLTDANQAWFLPGLVIFSHKLVDNITFFQAAITAAFSLENHSIGTSDFSFCNANL